MPNYRRVWVPGGTYFFTVNLLERDRTVLVDHIADLRMAFREARAVRAFEVLAIVVLPDHLHCVWRLPAQDADNATRWRHIKTLFSQRVPCTERRSARRVAKRERGVWQRRYWEHLLRDERDLCHHVDYIHLNPVKHGYVSGSATGRIRPFIAMCAKASARRIGDRRRAGLRPATFNVAAVGRRPRPVERCGSRTARPRRALQSRVLAPWNSAAEENNWMSAEFFSVPAAQSSARAEFFDDDAEIFSDAPEICSDHGENFSAASAIFSDGGAPNSARAVNFSGSAEKWLARAVASIRRQQKKPHRCGSERFAKLFTEAG